MSVERSDVGRRGRIRSGRATVRGTKGPLLHSPPMAVTEERREQSESNRRRPATAPVLEILGVLLYGAAAWGGLRGRPSLLAAG